MSEITACLVDIDDCLYPSHNGFLENAMPHIYQFWQTKNGISSEEFHRRNTGYRQQYTSSIQGFIINTPEFCIEEYQNYLDRHINYEELLQPNDKVVTMFREIQVPKVLVTNSTTRHAQKVLCRLGFQERDFDGLISINHMLENCKPDPRAYDLMLSRVQAPASQCLFMDDTLANVEAARKHGMYTFHVQNNILELPEHYPQIFYAKKNPILGL